MAPKLDYNKCLFTLGKSNLIDALGFALALQLPRGKHAHVRDLVYTSGNRDDDVERGLAAYNGLNDLDESEVPPGPRVMYV